MCNYLTHAPPRLRCTFPLIGQVKANTRLCAIPLHAWQLASQDYYTEGRQVGCQRFAPYLKALGISQTLGWQKSMGKVKMVRLRESVGIILARSEYKYKNDCISNNLTENHKVLTIF